MLNIIIFKIFYISLMDVLRGGASPALPRRFYKIFYREYTIKKVLNQCVCYPLLFLLLHYYNYTRLLILYYVFDLFILTMTIPIIHLSFSFAILPPSLIHLSFSFAILHFSFAIHRPSFFSEPSNQSTNWISLLAVDVFD